MNAAAGELRRSGLRVGCPVNLSRFFWFCWTTREMWSPESNCAKKIWTDQTFVDFEHGLNAAMNKLRRALGFGDERSTSKIPAGYGYRFIGDVELHRPIQTVSEGTPNLPPMSRVLTFNSLIRDIPMRAR